jgi:oligosaccharide repeat unit polymerase
MLNLALLLVLIAEVVFFTHFDKKIFGNYFSPVVILSYPIILILALAIVFSTALDFLPVNNSVLLLCIVGVFFFWFGSFFWSVIIPSKVINNVAERFKDPHIEVSANLKKVFQVFAWVVISIMLFSFYKTYRSFGHISAVGSDEFSSDYGGHGATGHILGLAIPLLIFFISIAKKKDYLTLLTIVFLVFLLLLYRVKTWLYIPLIGGVLLRYYNLRKFRIRIFPILISVLIVVLLFLLSYAFSVKADNYTFWEKVLMLLKHLTGYIFAGVLGFGEHIKHNFPIGESPKGLFMPYINLYNVITGHQVTGVVSPYHVFIDRRCLEDVNVKTFFGTILINGGYLIGILYTLIMSIILYFIWIVASVTKNYWFVILYVFFAAALVLGWFDFYYNQLPFLELPAYMIIFIILTNKKPKIQV